MPRHLAKINKIDPSELTALQRRIDITMGLILFAAALLLIRLWFLQIYRGDEYQRLSERNRTRVQEIAAPRGNILDRLGREIITNRPRFNVVLLPEDAPNVDEVIKNLARLLNEDISVFLDKRRAGSDHPRYLPIRLKEDIDWKTLVLIENNRINLPGIQIEVIPSRDYLYGNLASHTIGYLGEISTAELATLRDKGYRSGDEIGKLGVEKVFEEYLRGEKGRKFIEVDVHGLEQREIQKLEPIPGNNLHMTLDIDLQLAAEEAMAGKAGAVVAMDVHSGEILALASTPHLPLDKFVGGISSKDWKELLRDPLNPQIHKAIQAQYPPGSVYKIVTALAALSEGIVTPEASYYCSGSLSFGNRRYGCWKKAGHGTVNLKKALTESCDVYFYQVGIRLGVDTIAKYANSLGLGRKTGIVLENEKSGLIPTAAWKRQRFKQPWQAGENLSIAIGQGFDLTTPLQVCRMTAAVANGGTLYRPQLVHSISSPEGKIIKTFAPVREGRVLGSEQSLALIRAALVDVVHSPTGTAKVVRLDNNILVGGKTGTAQVVHLSHTKGMGESSIPYFYRDHAWFTGFAPADRPEIAVTALVEHGQHGGSAAGPVVRAVLKRYFDQKAGAPGATPQPAASSTPPPETFAIGEDEPAQAAGNRE